MANVSINNITETWSSSGTTYTGIKYNVTDNGSATGSKLIDLQVGGVSKFSIDKSGITSALFSNINSSGAIYVTSPSASATTTWMGLSGNGGFGYSNVGCVDLMYNGGRSARVTNNGFQIISNLYWSSSASTITIDLALASDGSNTLAQRNGINPQSYRLYLSYTDATNNSRFAINATSNYYRLASEIGTSTGSKKPIVTDIYQSTVDPTTTDIPDGTSTVWKNTTSGVVKLWANNGGTLIGVALA